MGNIPNVILYQVTEADLDTLAEKILNKFLEHHPQPQAEAEPQQTEAGPGPKFYTRKEIATLLGCSLPTVHQLLNTGVLRYTKIGHKTLIFKDYADRQIENGGLLKYRKRAKKDEA